MKIIFITDQPVPFGAAPTNRLLSLTTGVQANGCNSEIFVINPTEANVLSKNLSVIGSYQNVGFRYLNRSTIIPSGIFNKIGSYAYALFQLIPELTKVYKNGNIDAIIFLHTWSIYPIVVYLFFIRKRRPVFIQERNEYPFLNKNKSLLRRIDYFIYTKIALKCFDGMLVITKNLEKYYTQFLNKTAMIKVIPMTVEPERFSNCKKDDNHRYIAYCGYLGGNKDGVSDLIRAFALIHNEFPLHFLYIIGDSKNSADLSNLKAIVVDNKITEKVVFTGRVSRDQIPALLDRASVLALARPASIQAEGGFPTKLGEYLATGNPVVVTKVGEIPDYLNDGVNAYLANPDDICDFAAKLRQALKDKEKSAQIGQNGKQLAWTIFNHQTQGKEIINFINKVKNARIN